jgi:hypothetical protein
MLPRGRLFDWQRRPGQIRTEARSRWWRAHLDIVLTFIRMNEARPSGSAHQPKSEGRTSASHREEVGFPGPDEMVAAGGRERRAASGITGPHLVCGRHMVPGGRSKFTFANARSRQRITKSNQSVRRLEMDGERSDKKQCKPDATLKRHYGFCSCGWPR